MSQSAKKNPKMITKPRMLSMRMTEEQFFHLEEMIKLIESETGTKVTKSSLVLKLIEFGRPALEKLYPKAFSSENRFDFNMKNQMDEGFETDVEVEFIEEKKKRFFFFN